MKLFTEDGEEFDIKSFKKGSLVIAQVKKEMDNDEWTRFMKCQGDIFKEFNKRAVTLVFSPEWINFMEVKRDGTI